MEQTAETADAVAIPLAEPLGIGIDASPVGRCLHVKIEFSATDGHAKRAHHAKPLRSSGNAADLLVAALAAPAHRQIAPTSANICIISFMLPP